MASKACKITSVPEALSVARSAGLTNGTSAPAATDTLEISGQSVETTKRSTTSLSKAAWMGSMNSGRPQKGKIFLRCKRFEPPRAAIMPRMFIRHWTMKCDNPFVLDDSSILISRDVTIISHISEARSEIVQSPLPVGIPATREDCGDEIESSSLENWKKPHAFSKGTLASDSIPPRRLQEFTHCRTSMQTTRSKLLEGKSNDSRLICLSVAVSPSRSNHSRV